MMRVRMPCVLIRWIMTCANGLRLWRVRPIVATLLFALLATTRWRVRAAAATACR